MFLIIITIDTIRRRAGLRATFAVHRHPQLSTTTNSKLNGKSPEANSLPTNHRTSVQRNATIAVVPSTSPSPKKVEKDILKHASRIRTNHLKDYFARQQKPFPSYAGDHVPSISNSPTRTNHPKKCTSIPKQPKSISLVSVHNIRNKINA